MPSVHAQVRKIAEDYDKTLTASDFPYDVEIVHGDGTLLVFANAFLRLWQDPEWKLDSGFDGLWLLVFTEHHLVHTYPTCDLEHYAQHERQDPARLHAAVRKWRKKNYAQTFPIEKLP